MNTVSRGEGLCSSARTVRTWESVRHRVLGRRFGVLLVAALAACTAGTSESPFPPGGSSGPGTSLLVVSPTTPLLSTGEVGKTFAPGAQVYTLRNGGAFPLPWAARVDQSWITLSASSGTLNGGESEGLTVTIDQAQAATFPLGFHIARVTITDNLTGDEFYRDVGLQVTLGGLVITPEAGFTSNGEQGGPFSPAGTEYVILNQGSDPVDWTASVDQPWLQVSTTSGQVLGGAYETVLVSIEPTVASALGQGSYVGTATFTDTTNAQVFQRQITLNVTVVIQSDLVVTPTKDLNSVGEEGGPFTPASQDYTLANQGNLSLNWTASADEPWIQLSATGGTLAASQQTTLSVSIDQGLASALGLGFYSGTVQITDTTAGKVEVRNVTLQVNPVSGGGNFATSLTQFGITWNFDRAYEVGRFANGDWWVVGPVTIIGITPVSTEINGRTANGSMVNPSPRDATVQGYDSAMYAQYKREGDYNARLNKALDVSVANPLALAAGTSLVSTISEPTPNVRPQVRTAAILTVLPQAASPGDFRPAYCGTDKTIYFNESQLQYGLLERLEPVAGGAPVTSLSAAERMFERPWIDHVPLWIGRYSHPTLNMPDYGREMTDNVSVAALLLHMDYEPEDKRTLLVRFVQLGIDLWGIGVNGGEGNWRSSAGHLNGRKWPILFAGLVLGDVEMSNVGYDKPFVFSEDDQTFYVAETPPGSGIYNNGYGGYGAQHLGMVDWGQNHPRQPWLDDVNWYGDPYRLCCTANAWWGQLLAAHIMGRQWWDHQAVFDYQDRFRQVNLAQGVLDWRNAWRDWYFEMWEKYRNDY